MRILEFLLFAAVLGIASISAQQQPTAEATEFRKPGDVIRYEIRFSGPDADKIRSVSLYFNVTGSGPTADQTGFVSGFNGGGSGPSAPRVFTVSAAVPENVASGDYMVFVNVQSDAGRFQYASGKQFQIPLVHIRNDRTFVPPQITVTELREH